MAVLFLGLVLLISCGESGNPIPRSADPCNAWARPGWMDGPEKVVTPELRDGNASHNLSPAEIIFYSVSENTIGEYKINPVLVLTYLESADLLSQGKDYGDFEFRLLTSVGYGGAGIKKYHGFYPQLVASTFQWYAYQKRGLDFEEAQTQYSFVATRPFKEAYAEYAAIMNQIVGTNFSLNPDSQGYYQDFSGFVSAENIQSFLEAVDSSLKEKNLFRQFPVLKTRINYACMEEYCE